MLKLWAEWYGPKWSWADLVMGRNDQRPPGFYQLKHVKALEEMKTAGNGNKF